VTVTFEDGTDIYLARQVVSERLGPTVDLPPGIERPKLGPVATGLGEVFHYLVTGDGHTLAELRTAQDWIIKPQLRSVPGVAEVNGWGGDERQIHVVVDPPTCEARPHARSARRSHRAQQPERGRRHTRPAGESRLLQGLGSIGRPEDLEKIVIAAHDGVPVRVATWPASSRATRSAAAP
jgi:cobalt-zinc-cadmium resistance protein CzcA